jgi:hypothetical protein
MLHLREYIRENHPELQARLNEIERSQSLAMMVMNTLRFVFGLGVEIVEAELAERAHADWEWGPCPECGRRLQSKGWVGRQLTTVLGQIRWERRVGRCPQRCANSLVVPLDQQLGIEANQQTSWELQKIACGLAVFVPFEIAALLLEQWLPVPVSATGIWGWVQQMGAREMAYWQAELERFAGGERPDGGAPPQPNAPLLIGADGVMVPFRASEGDPRGRIRWREVKVGIVAWWTTHTTGSGKSVTRLQGRRLTAVLGDIDARSPRLHLTALIVGLAAATQVAWLSDGGRGFWGLYAHCFATDAMGILDFYHAAQNLWKAAAAWWDGRTNQAKDWFTQSRHQLRHGEAQAVIADLAAALALQDLPEPTRDTIAKVHDYLTQHQAHIDYARFQQLGLPLGSGMVESACKWLIQQRFKGVGMRWSEEGFNHLLHLRLAWVNGEFDHLFSVHADSNL